MKPFIIIFIFINLLFAYNTGNYIDGYQLPRKDNKNLKIINHHITVGFSVNRKVYPSDNPTIIYKVNDKVVEAYRGLVGYDYIRKSGNIRANIYINKFDVKHTFILKIDGKIIDSFSIGNYTKNTIDKKNIIYQNNIYIINTK